MRYAIAIWVGILICFIALGTQSQVYGQLRVTTAPQGGTGIGSAVVGDVGNCLKVSDDSPFTYTLGTCGSGSTSGGNSKWATSTDTRYIQPNNAAGGFQATLATTTYATSTHLSLSGDLWLGGSRYNVLDGDGIAVSNGQLNCNTATASQFGCLSTAQFTIFNEKVSSSSISDMVTWTGATSSLWQVANLLSNGSSTLQNFTGLRSTTTNSTSTNTFSTTASSSILSSALARLGALGVGTDNTGAAFIQSRATAATQGLRIEGSNTTDLGFSTFITGDSNLRYFFTPSGYMAWGSGGAAEDVYMQRTAAGQLTVTGNYVVTGNSTTTHATTTTSAVTSLASTSMFSVNGLMWLNNNSLRLRGDTDGNHEIRYDSTTDGPLIKGFAGFTLNDTNGALFAGNGTELDAFKRLNLNSNDIQNISNGTSTIWVATTRASTTELYISGLVGCDTIDTNGQGLLACGTDAQGGASEHNEWVNSAGPTSATSSNLIFGTGSASSTAVGNFNITGNSTTTHATTTTLFATTASTTNLFLSLGSGLLKTTNGLVSLATANTDYVGTTRSLTINGTANQITSSAGAQDLSADRTWTLSLPSHVIFPSSFQATRSTTTHATSTNHDITGLLTFNGVTASTWAGFCSTITGSADLCDGNDASGGGGGGGNSKWATSTDLSAISLGGALKVGIGTTTPQWALQVASSTGPQLTLSDSNAVTTNHWSFRNAGGLFYLATSSASTFATSTTPALSFTANGVATINAGFITSFATMTQATTTHLYAGIASSTQLFATNSVFASTTIGRSTTTHATTSSLFVSGNASTSILFLGTGTGCLSASTAGLVSANGVSCLTAGAIQQSKWATSTDVSAITLAGALKVGIGTSTPQWALQVASSTGPQLTLSDSSSKTVAHWSVRNAGGNLYFATSSASTFATTTPAALTLFNVGQPSLGIATTSFNGQLGIGSTTAALASTTISMGKLQFDGYSPDGTRYCVFIANGGTMTVTAGACNP